MDSKEFIIERLILKTGNAINNIRTNDLEENGLTPAQSETVLFYSARPGASIKDLSMHLKITHQAARKLVEKLKIKGILEALVSDADKRYASIYLTGDGKKLCRKLKNSGADTGETILRGFSEKEKDDLLKLIQRIDENISENQSDNESKKHT